MKSIRPIDVLATIDEHTTHHVSLHVLKVGESSSRNGDLEVSFIGDQFS